MKGTASTALCSLSTRLSRRRSAKLPPHDDALLRQLEARVAPATLDALRGTSELPAGSSPKEAAALLRRYLAAEQQSVSKAALRLEQQAEWRRRFGVVTAVGGCLQGWAEGGGQLVAWQWCLKGAG